LTINSYKPIQTGGASKLLKKALDFNIIYSVIKTSWSPFKFLICISVNL